jgi:hypothetical protein
MGIIQQNIYRDGSYSQSSETISLENVTLEDSGYYYCTVSGLEDETRVASLQLQVNIPLFYNANSTL